MTSPTSSIRTIKREPGLGRYSPSPIEERNDGLGEPGASTSTTSTGIPVPRMPTSSAQSPSIGALGIRIGERERDRGVGASSFHSSSSYYQSPSTHHPSTARSPSGSSLSSHRSHPYARRESFPPLQPEPNQHSHSYPSRDTGRDLPRIHLPAPPPAPDLLLKIEANDRTVPPLSNLVIQSPRERPEMRRSPSAGSSGRPGVQLPSLHSITGTTISPTSQVHSAHPNYSPRRSILDDSRPVSPRSPPRRAPSPAALPLRPSYSYEPFHPSYPPPAEYDRRSPASADIRYPPPHEHPSLRQHHRASETSRYEHDPYPPSSHHSQRETDQQHPAFPSRQAHHSSHPQSHSHYASQLQHESQHRHHHIGPERTSHHSSSASSRRRVSPTKYQEPASPLRTVPPELRGSMPQPPGAYYASSNRYGDPPTRSRSQSHSSNSIRGQPPPEPNADQGPGQNRRLAHLMSEQKRRESINSGFTALRSVLPTSAATDSKAIILRKAVSHIHHIEGLLRKAGVNPSISMSAPVLTPSSWDDDHDRIEGYNMMEGPEQGDVDMDEDRGGWSLQEAHGLERPPMERHVRETQREEGGMRYRTMPASSSSGSRRKSRQ